MIFNLDSSIYPRVDIAATNTMICVFARRVDNKSALLCVFAMAKIPTSYLYTYVEPGEHYRTDSKLLP